MTDAPKQDIKPFLIKATEGILFTCEEAVEIFGAIMSGGVAPEQVAAFLTALRMRGESVEEITAGAQIMRAKAVPVEAPINSLDCCGTGGDGSGTYNSSAAVSFIVAACGIPVAKHGNRALTSRSGSSEVLEKLGIKLDITPEHISKCISDAGIGFMFAPTHHTAMKYVGPVRGALGFRTIFNLLGPLSNPSGARRQLLGVFDAQWVEPLAYVLKNLGTERVWVVHGSDGLDELTTTGPSHVAELKDGTVQSFTVNPEEAGLPLATSESLRGGTPEENAIALRALLKGKKSPYRDIVLLNAAAALIVADKAETLSQGVAMAGEAIDTGAALTRLDDLIKLTNG
ncbi:MAG: anthranilate phosphoribosyltransferase [Parvularculales bacterium]